MKHNYPDTPIGNIFRSWTGQPPKGDSECQLCGLPMMDADRIRIRLTSEHPSSVRLVCEHCADRCQRNNQTRKGN